MSIVFEDYGFLLYHTISEMAKSGGYTMTTGINDEMKQAIQEGVRAYLTELTRGSITDELRGIVTGHVRNFDYRAAVGDLSGSLKATVEETVRKELAQRLMKARPLLLERKDARKFEKHTESYRLLQEFSLTGSERYDGSRWNDAWDGLKGVLYEQALDAAAVMGASVLVVRNADVIRNFEVPQPGVWNWIARRELHGKVDAAAYAVKQ